MELYSRRTFGNNPLTPLVARQQPGGTVAQRNIHAPGQLAQSQSGLGPTYAALTAHAVLLIYASDI